MKLLCMLLSTLSAAIHLVVHLSCKSPRFTTVSDL